MAAETRGRRRRGALAATTHCLLLAFPLALPALVRLSGTSDAGGEQSFTPPAAAPTRPPPGGRRLSVTGRRASEAALAKLVAEFPSDYDKDDMDEVQAVIRKLPAAGTDAFELLVGNWIADWSTMGGQATPKGEGKAVPIKFMSFNALPDVPVIFRGSYNRVLDTRENRLQPMAGVYELLQVFTVPGSEGVTAAMVLSGPWSSGSSEGEWGKGAPRTRCGVQFQTVRLALSSEDPDASKAMLEAAGLAEYLEPVPLDAKATYIDITYISKAMRTHKGETGQTYVLSRISDEIPFFLDGAS